MMKNKIGRIFKTINKKQARVISVVFALATIAMVYDLIKDFNSGLKLGDLKYSLLLTVAVILIEFSMLTIAFSKDENTEDEAEEDEDRPEAVLEGSNEREGSEEFTEGLNEEFGGYSGSEGGEYGGSEGGFGGETGDAGGEGGGDAG